MSETIYVVGFPKSGNTWLTRLLADTLNAPVVPRVMRGQLEIASEVNRTLAVTEEPTLQIAKVHFLPEFFVREVEPRPHRVVYIYRDLRDVAVSAFFYFTGIREADLQRSVSESAMRGPLALYRRYAARRRMAQFVEDLILRGIPGLEQAFGTWTSHYRAWQRYASEHPNMLFCPVAYETLLASTEQTMHSVLTGLHLTNTSPQRVRAAVERQAFGSLKRYYEQLPDDSTVPLSKAFNLHFLRRGVTGDGARLLSPQLVELIDARCGDLLTELGYNERSTMSLQQRRAA